MAASVSYQASDSDTSGSSTITFPLTVASAAGQERLVAVGFITNGTPTNLVFGSVTIDGQSATEVLKVARAGTGDGTVMILYRAPGTSGTSINVVVTLSAGSNYGAHCSLWTLSDADTLFASTTSVLDTPTLNVNTPANGVLVAAGFAFGSGGTSTWTGATERFDGVEVFDAVHTVADATTTAQTPRAVSITWSTSHGERASFAASFNPDATGVTLTGAAGAYTLTGTTAIDRYIMPLDQAGGDWPDTTTTGVPDGVSLTPVGGNYTSSSNGQVITALNVSGTIIVAHTGVTIRNCRAWNISVDVGNGAGANSVVEDCEVIGGDGNSAIGVVEVDGCIIRRCDISGTENGIYQQGTNFTIADNYVHDLDTSGADPHTDGVQIPNGEGVGPGVIRHNNFALHATSSSTLTMSDAHGVTIDDNRMNGGTYILYFGTDAVGNVITNNVFGEHVFGYIDDESTAGQTYTGNYDEVTGAPVTP